MPLSVQLGLTGYRQNITDKKLILFQFDELYQRVKELPCPAQIHERPCLDYLDSFSRDTMISMRYEPEA
jgi:hypothetical protein